MATIRYAMIGMAVIAAALLSAGCMGRVTPLQGQPDAVAHADESACRSGATHPVPQWEQDMAWASFLFSLVTLQPGGMHIDLSPRMSWSEYEACMQALGYDVSRWGGGVRWQ